MTLGSAGPDAESPLHRVSRGIPTSPALETLGSMVTVQNTDTVNKDTHAETKKIK